MNYTELQIDDDCLNAMAEYLEKQGILLQDMADAYVAILKCITEEGIIKGETAHALKNFLNCAEQLKSVIVSTSMQAQNSVRSYREEINACDQYQY